MNRSSRFQKISRCYHSSAILLFNCVLVFVALNLIAALGIEIIRLSDRLGGKTNPIAKEYGPETVRKVYPDLSPAQTDALLKETWTRPLMFEPFTQFKERPYKGEYVNVDASGFRQTRNQGPWPPTPRAINIFLFGGSTVFGYGVPDGETIASYLQDYLCEKIKKDVRVYNFGRGYYYLNQERILFETLLTQGHTPAISLFVDGVNEAKYGASNEPYLTPKLRDYIEHGQKEPRWGRVFTGMPLSRLVRILKERASRSQVVAAAGADSLKSAGRIGEQPDSEAGKATAVIQNYLQNKRVVESVSREYGIKTAFVWQPSPYYNCDSEEYDFLSAEEKGRSFTRKLYEQLNEYRSIHDLGDDFLWCADIQKGLVGPLYVDKIHYSSRFCLILAETIGDMLLRKNYLNH